MIIQTVHNTPFLFVFVFFILLSLSVSQTAAVGSVLRVNDHLHLELSSQHGFSRDLFFLLYGFDLCLESEILVSQNTKKNEAINIQFGCHYTDSDVQIVI